jgi:hypothetical protein
LLSDTCRERRILNTDYIEHILRLNDQGRSMDLQLWTMITFELWCRRFMDVSVASESEHASSVA